MQEYDKNPVGLNKNDHYEMADQIFHACVLAMQARVPLPSIRAETPQPRGLPKKKMTGRRLA